MNRELLSKAFGDMDESFVLEAYRPVPGDAAGAPERIVHMKKKRIVTAALAAVLALALGITAYGAWSVHAARQRELRDELGIDEGIGSYEEYAVPETEAGGLVLLSAVNDGQEQRLYMDISPVSEEEAAAFDAASPFPVFTLEIEGTEIGGSAYPMLSAGASVSGSEEMRAAVLQNAYDPQTRTLTLQGFLFVSEVKRAMAELGTDTVSLTVRMYTEDGASRTFGPIPFAMTGEQLRSFDFGSAVYHDPASGREIEVAGLDLAPFGAVWKVRYEDDAALQAGKYENWEAYKPWCDLEERVCRQARIVLSDGTEFSTGGSLNSRYEDGAVQLWCSWRGAVDIENVRRIVLDDLVLWEAE